MSEHPENLPPHDPRFPENYPDATGKGDVHIPGAGTFGMAMLIVSLSVLFIASMVAYLFIRWQQSQPPHVWKLPMFPHIPHSLWISTFIIILASVTVQRAHAAVRRDDNKALTGFLMATFIIGILFLLMQTANWIEFWLAIRNIRFQGAYLVMFYVLTALHAAHVVGGLIPLAVVYVRAGRGRYSRNFHPGVRYVAIYWHFLDIIWLMLFCVLYF